MKGLAAMLAAAPLQSPRIVGTAAHGLGRMYGSISPQLNGTPAAATAMGNLIRSFRNPNELEKLTNAQIPYRSSIPVQ
jgi:hypothetical protein